MQRNLTPLGGAVDEQHNIADIRGFEHGSTDARLLNQFRDVEERGKIEASAHAAKLTHLPANSCCSAIQAESTEGVRAAIRAWPRGEEA